MKNIHSEIYHHLSLGDKVYSLAAGRCGQVISVSRNSVELLTGKKKTAFTSFEGGDEVYLKRVDEKTFHVMNLDF